MFTRIPDEYYNEIPMCPTTPMMRSTQMFPKHENFKHAMQRQQPETTAIPDFEIKPGPAVLPPKYSQNWLIEQIGKYIKVEFLIGTTMYVDREGILKEVGVNYIILKESGTKDDVMCDMYSIKFVRVFDDQNKAIICK